MMGRGAEGGISHTSGLSSLMNHIHPSQKNSGQVRGMDIYSQALKALAVKSPFGGDDAGGSGGPGTCAGGPLVKLPSSGDPKRKNRARKTQAVSKKRNFGDIDSCGDGNPRLFWAQMEDYFREVTAEDIQLLFPRTNLGLLESNSVQDPCFVIRPLGRRYLEVWAEEDGKYRMEGGIDFEAVAEQSARGVKRKLLTASPVSKRRKVLAVSSSADVITTVISPPDPEEEELCHVCNGGDSDEWNQILFCDSCNVAVHQECYGVHNVPDGQWLCSWCSQKLHNSSEVGAGDAHKCVLCTVKGGALKPIADESDAFSKYRRFAHLFCCQWVPETYIQDTEAMEPVRNIEGIREERWRLLCVVCKEKHGACIQCSHGLCATPFHPLCARDAKFWMEVSSREDSDDVELRAYCHKHSSSRMGKTSLDFLELKDGLSEDQVIGATGNVNDRDKGRTSTDSARVDIGDKKLSNDAHIEERSSIEPAIGLDNGLKMDLAWPGSINGKSPSKILDARIGKESPDEVHSGAEVAVSTKTSPEFNQGQLRTCLRELIENLGMPVATIAFEASVPQDLLSMWLEGKLHDDASKLNASICGWLCTSSVLKRSLSGSERDRHFNKLKRNGYGDEEKGEISIGEPAHENLSDGNSPRTKGCAPDADIPKRTRECRNHWNGDVALVRTNCQDVDDSLTNNDMDSDPVDKLGRESMECLQQDKVKLKVDNGLTQSGTVQMGTMECDDKTMTSKCTTPNIVSRTKEHSSSDEVEESRAQGEDSAKTGLYESANLIPEASPKEVGQSTKCENINVRPYVAPAILRRLSLLAQNISLEETGLQTSGLSVADEARECNITFETVSALDDQWEQLRQAKQLGILDWSPQDELEGEIFVLQNQLIECAHSNLYSSERLISKILSQLSKERQATRKQTRDLSVVSQFISDAKEAKKQGRKEKRDKEAQAVLAAATAAAAASPRTGYVKRDGSAPEEAYYASHDPAEYKLTWPLSNGNPHSPTVRPFKPPIPRPPKLNISSSYRMGHLEKGAGFLHKSNSLQLQEDHFTCDVCSTSDSVRSNRILQCGRCKVAVHQDCYGIARPLGVWYCQPCAEAQRQQPSVDPEKSLAPGVQCVLCPSHYGAFRRSSDGRWVHVFCALWIPETTFGKEQTAAIGGLEAVPIERFNLICSICQDQQGACVKCNFGHCYGAFHPICARDSGLYMSVKSIGGRTHYRAYCERHSDQQRAKAELKQYSSSDEMNALRQIRVEFERVRLICERICKRERIKRELAHCIKDLYVTQLNVMAVTGGLLQPTFEHVVRNNHESLGQRVQRLSDGNCAWYTEGLLEPWGVESKLGSAEHCHESLWPVEKPQMAGVDGNWCRRAGPVEQSACTASATDLSVSGFSGVGKPMEGHLEVRHKDTKEQKKPKKYNRHSEPLGREKIMTPSEASMHNKLLPKGYAYVPVDMLEKGAVSSPALQQQEQIEKKNPQ